MVDLLWVERLCNMPSSVLRAASMRYDVAKALRRGKRRRKPDEDTEKVATSNSNGSRVARDRAQRYGLIIASLS